MRNEFVTYPARSRCALVCSFNGEKANLTCKVDGRWNGTLPDHFCEEPKCPPAHVPQNAVIFPTGHCENVGPGHYCNMTCNTGFTTIDDTQIVTIQCDKDKTGKWLGEPIHCYKKTCRPYEAPENGVVSFTWLLFFAKTSST